MLGWLVRHSSIRLLLGLSAAYVVVFGLLIAGSDSSSGIVILDLRFNYDVATVYQVLEGLGEEGRRSYRLNALTLDVVYPLVYSLTFAVLLVLLIPLDRARHPLGFIALAPFSIAIFDLIENACIAALVTSYPSRIEWLAELVSWATPVKWTVAGLVLATIAWFGLRRLWLRLSAR